MKKKYYVFINMFIVFILLFTNIFGIKGNLYILLRNIPKRTILKNIESYKELETDHFIIRYETKDMDMLKLVERASEEYYDEICKQYNYYPKDKTVVILYDNSEELLKNSRLGKSKPPMGVYYASTIQILSPKIWCDGDIEYLFMNEGPMVHEFTHRIVDDVTKGNYPLWFTEGLALYSEYIYTEYEWGKEIEEEKIYTIDELNNNFNNLNQYLAYTQSFRVVKYMVDTYGFEKVKDILKKLETGYTFNRAFEIITKDKVSKLNV